MMNMEKLEMLLSLGNEMLDFVNSFGYGDDNSEIDLILFNPDTYTLDLSFDEVVYKIEHMIYDEEIDEEYFEMYIDYVEMIKPIYNDMINRIGK